MEFIIENNVLKGVTAPESVVHIPEGVSEIAKKAFYMQQDITEIYVPDSVEKIGNFAFFNCSHLRKIRLPETLAEIPFCCFNACFRLEEVNFPAALSTIWHEGFFRCNHLKEVVIGENVTLYDKAFAECSALERVEIRSMYDIPSEAFADCISLRVVVLNKWIRRIGNAAFMGCISLKSVNIPAYLDSIDFQAFEGCSSLSELSFPTHMKFVAPDAFSGTPFMAQNDKNCIISVDYLFKYTGEDVEYHVPDGIRNIGTCAISGRDNLKHLYLPNNLAPGGIKKYAVRSCHALETIRLPSSLEVVQYDFITDCPNLKTCYIRSSGETITLPLPAEYDPGKFISYAFTCIQFRHFKDLASDTPMYTDTAAVSLFALFDSGITDSDKMLEANVQTVLRSLVRLGLTDCVRSLLKTDRITLNIDHDELITLSAEHNTPEITALLIEHMDPAGFTSAEEQFSL